MGWGMAMVAAALAHFPSTRLETAYGSALAPMAAGSTVAHDGMLDEEDMVRAVKWLWRAAVVDAIGDDLDE